jgi:hypothetical protein
MSFAALLEQADRAVLNGPLGGAVTYTPTVGDAETVRGIFDATYTKVDAGEAGVSLTGPAVFLRIGDLPSDPVTDITATVTVGSQEYKVREAEPDGTGGVLLLLQRI